VSGTGSTQPREYNWGATWEKSSGFGLEDREYDRKDPSHWPRDTLYPENLTLTSPTNGGRLVGIVRSPRSLVYDLWYYVYLCTQFINDCMRGITARELIMTSIRTNWLAFTLLHERTLCGRSRRKKQIICQSFVSVLWLLIIFWFGYVKCSALYEGRGLRLIICSCYLWEMVLNVLDVFLW
jgi:hypothetical protein